MLKIFEGSGGNIMPLEYIKRRREPNMLILRRLYFNQIREEAENMKAAMSMFTGGMI